jgi:hypothetical protein
METLNRKHSKLDYVGLQDKLKELAADGDLEGFDEFSVVVTAKEVAPKSQTKLDL